ncbi:serine/threonine-protein kinase [Pseudonocardia sediminis]|uniref:serine/threonine-protein kinase n=1 Tax=Pseudonocardia sediminis TaxID=1397368 RepID=UPI00102A9F33|nr:serine/threonine-protein kinase [Pseudonocardia sediminis]
MSDGRPREETTEVVTGPTVLSGRYELVRLLGEGGMSQVHLAHDRELGRDVAVKILPTGGDRDAEDLERLRDEARAAASISHPGVVTVHDIGTTRDGLFVVMAYVDGESLADRLKRSGTLDPADAVVVGQAVCDALEAAHRAGVVHRDVTPGNIMLGRDGSVTVTDFGIARMGPGAGRTRTGYIVGTPSYLAPEQGHGGDLDGRADLYALGCCLFTALIGRPPFEDDDSFAVVLAHMRSDPPRPRRLRADIPEALEAVILRVLSKDPNRRYPDAAAMAVALGESIGARDATPRGHTLELPNPGETGSSDPPWVKPLPRSAGGDPAPGPDSEPVTRRTTAAGSDSGARDAAAPRRSVTPRHGMSPAPSQDAPATASGGRPPDEHTTALDSTLADVESEQGRSGERRRGIGFTLIGIALVLVVLAVLAVLFLG